MKTERLTGTLAGRGNIARDLQRMRFVHPALVGPWPDIAADFQDAYPGSYITVTKDGGYRTPAMQAVAKREGASPFDGKSRFSKHQRMRADALDFAVIAPAHETRWKKTNGYVTDGTDPRYAFVGRSYEKRGLSWGGRWHGKGKKPDWDHVERRVGNPNKVDVAAGYAEYERLTAPKGRTADGKTIAV